MKIDFGKTSEDYRTYRRGFPQSFFDTIEKLGIINGRDSLLDVGTGTGTLARGFARKGLNVTGLDISESLLIEARSISKDENLDIQYRHGFAEKTEFPDNTFDIVSAGQCWHWFERDKTARELKRILKPEGSFIIAHYDWIPLDGNVVEHTEKLIMKHNPRWNMGGGTGMYPLWFKDVSLAGFVNIKSFTFDTVEIYSKEAWRGRIRASAGVSASLSDKEVEVFDKELADYLSEINGDDLEIPHRVFALYCDKLK